MNSADDHFAALGLPRRAALDAEAVREAFQRAGKATHPDAGGSAAGFEVINGANAILSDPAARLKHLAQLEFGEAPDAAGAVSAETMDLFAAVGSALAAADALLGRRAGAGSAIARALLAKDEAEASAAVLDANGAVRARKANATGGLAAIDAALAGGDRELASRLLGEGVRELAFLGKWEAQLGERMTALLAG